MRHQSSNLLLAGALALALGVTACGTPTPAPAAAIESISVTPTQRAGIEAEVGRICRLTDNCARAELRFAAPMPDWHGHSALYAEYVETMRGGGRIAVGTVFTVDGNRALETKYIGA